MLPRTVRARLQRSCRARRWRGAAVLGALAVAMSACSSGESALQSGADRTTAPAPETSETSEITGNGSAPETTGDGTGAPETSEPVATDGPGGTGGDTTVTTEPEGSPLDDLPACPVEALDGHAGPPVEIRFWHAMGNELETSLIGLTEAYNAGQDRVHVVLENQIGYNENLATYVQSSVNARPAVVQLSEVATQAVADSGTVVPVGACLEAAGTDTSAMIDRVMAAYQTGGVQWSMPFNVSNPVLYYNRPMFEEAGLDPDDPPTTLSELRDAARAIVDSGAAASGIALDTGVDSGGGWFIEQWLARAGEMYADNDNGRSALATEVLFAGPAGVDLLTYVQDLITDGLAVNVGDNPSEQDHFLRMADPSAPAAMTIGTSAALGTLTVLLDSGFISGMTGADLGVGPMPGPDGPPSALVGGASLYVVDGKTDLEQAAAWDYIAYLTSAETQATWAAETGYVPIRDDAPELEPLASTYAEDPRFRVPFDQLLGADESPASFGPILGPHVEVRAVTARAVAEIFAGGDVEASLSRAADLADALLADYAARN